MCCFICSPPPQLVFKKGSVVISNSFLPLYDFRCCVPMTWWYYSENLIFILDVTVFWLALMIMTEIGILRIYCVRVSVVWVWMNIAFERSEPIADNQGCRKPVWAPSVRAVRGPLPRNFVYLNALRRAFKLFENLNNYLWWHSFFQRISFYFVMIDKTGNKS